MDLAERLGLRVRCRASASLKVIHAFLTLIVWWFAAVLFLNDRAFLNPAFSYFQFLGSTETWAYMMLGVGVIGFLGFACSNRAMTIVSVVALTVMHMLMAYCFYMGAPLGGTISTGVGTYALVAALGYALLVLILLS